MNHHHPYRPQISQIPADLIRVDTHDPRRSTNPHPGICPAPRTVPCYWDASPDGERHHPATGRAQWVTTVSNRTGSPTTANYSLLTANSTVAPPAPPAHPILNSSFLILNWSYTFSAKEKDTETGYSYFGARYYSSDLSIWLSVDPMAAKYASTSPYAYCRNNPIVLIDPNGMFDDGYQDGNGNYQWFDNHHESSFTENGITWTRVTGNKNDWDEATTIRDAVIEGLVSLGYDKDEVKKDVSLYSETSNLFTKEAQLNNFEKYIKNWNKSFNSDTKKRDAFKSGEISNTSLMLKFYPTKGGEKNAIGIVKMGLSHWIEAGKEAVESFRCNKSGIDPKTDPYSDMHYDNAVLLLKSVQYKGSPVKRESSWVDAVYWRTGGMR